MSGHSKWETIKRAKGANDAKRAAVFTKLGNLIAVAARGGTDPTTNSTLAMVIEKAKAANMPMSNIERAIQRVADKSSAALEEVMYEGYGPGGVGVLVECATDNINRTYPEVKLAFSKSGGSIAEKGSVAFQFARKGQIRIKGSGEDLLLCVLDAGAEDAVEQDGEMIVYTAPTNLAKVRTALQAAGIEVIEAELTFVPNTTTEIADTETARRIMNLMDRLDDLYDVTNIYTNFYIQE
jgi:YebC/PmpR family DNA-binding regulatory protein